MQGLRLRPSTLQTLRSYTQIVATANATHITTRPRSLTVADYNVELSQLHHRVWQEELGLPATIDEYGWVDFGATNLGELCIILREYSPEGMQLSVKFFTDPTLPGEHLLRICNSVNSLVDAKLTVNEPYGVVRASLYLLLEEDGQMPDEALLRAVIGPAIRKIVQAMEEFTKELQKLADNLTIS